MAHTKFFKDNLKTKLKKALREYGIKEINSDYEETIFAYNQIFWDFNIQLRHHNIIVLLEIETERRDPISNLIKTLIWLYENSPNNYFIFIHFFDSSYTDTLAKKICDKLWEFLNQNYKKNLIYSSHSIDELKKVAQSKRKTKELHPVCKRISEIVGRVIDRKIKGIGKKS